ncbi:MAG: hypothetical protein ACM34F_02810 [Betaproteobacteria bacterium]
MTGGSEGARRAPPDRSSIANRTGIAAWNALLVVAFVTGTALRVWQIDIQILIDDEWHAIHKLLRAGPLDILTHLGYADYSVPLTLYYQALYRTIGLSEWGMHVPPLLAGVGLLLIGPRLLADLVPLPVRAVWTALVATSPLLVYHSKVARPYAITSLLTFVAIVAFHAWWRDGRRRDGALYALATVLAGWLHATTLPFTLLPFVFHGVRAFRPVNRAALSRLMALGVATALPLALVLVPPFVNDWSQIGQKAGRDAVTLESGYRTSLMLAGTGSAIVAALFLIAVVVGFRRLARRDGLLAWYLATVIGVATVVVVATGAEWIAHPLVLARYLIPALPFLLVFAAEGVVGALAFARWPAAEALAAAALVSMLLVAGPIATQWGYPNQFWGHLRYQFDYDPAHNPYVLQVPRDPVPAFYTELAKRPAGSVTLVEAPWRLESHFNALSLFQGVHHQLIRVGLATPACGAYDYGEYPEDRRMHMREFVHLSALLRGDTAGADYLVMHPAPHHVAAPPDRWPDISGCLPRIEARFGAPVYRDERIIVFALTGVSPLGNTRRTVQQ